LIDHDDDLGILGKVFVISDLRRSGGILLRM
jgi:hypothetical protein